MSSSNFMPHLHCYLGNPLLTWGMFTTDLLIGAAYFGISLTLWTLVKRTNISLSPVVLCFGIFIGACGLTHFLEVWTLWKPDYYYSLFVKAVTSLASVGTGIYLYRLRHKIVALVENARTREEFFDHRTRLHETILDQMPSAVIVAEAPSGKLVSANKRVLPVWRHNLIPSENIDQYSNWIGFHKDGRRYEGKDWPLARAILNGEVIINEETHVQFGDGTHGILNLSAAPVKAADGKIIAGVVICDDITEAKTRERKLEETIALLNAITETSSDVIYAKDSKSRMIYGNPATFELIGKPSEIVIGKNDVEFLGPNNGGEQILENDKKVMTSGNSQTLTETIGQGETARVFESKKSPFKNAIGETIGIVGISRDITEQIRAQEQLKESENRLSLALKASNMGFYDWDILNDKVLFSEDMRRQWGVIKDPPTLQAALDLIHPEDRKRVYSRIQAALDHGEPYLLEYRIIRPIDQAIAWVVVRGEVHRTSEGIPCRFIGTSVDVTERKHAELRLAESETKFRQLANSIPQLAWIANADGSIQWYNDQWYKYTGTTPEFMKGSGWEPLIHPEDLEATVQAWNQAVKTRSDYHFDHRLLMANGSYRWHSSRATPFIESDGRVEKWFGTASDIQEQVEIQQQLRAAKEAADRASQLKSAFLANMSHEIRTPLGAMLGFADLLRDPELAPSERTEYTDVLTRNGQQLAAVINDILDLSKVEAGQMDIERIECNPVALAEDVFLLFQVKAKEKNLTFTFERPLNLSRTIFSDPVRIRQVLMNLVGNAIKFTERGRVSVVVEFSEQGNRTQVLFKIEDTGLGIPPEQQERIFELFTQADNSMTRKFGGTGLGLALSRKLAQSLGGNVKVLSSEIGKGSVFLFSISDKGQS